MPKLRLAALALTVAGSALLARPAEATYRPPEEYCCVYKAKTIFTETIISRCCYPGGCTVTPDGCRPILS